MEKFWKKIIEFVFGEGTEIVFPRFFISKKNQVTLFHLRRQDRDFSVIAKFYVWGNGMREWRILQKAYKAGLNVPAPMELIRVRNEADKPGVVFSRLTDADLDDENLDEIESCPGYILFTEYIPGISFRDLKGETVNLPVDKLALWMADFHNLFKIPGKQGTMLKGDVMMPNFLLHGETGEVFGIDFEEAIRGNEIIDISDILTSLMLLRKKLPGRSPEIACDFIRNYRSKNPISLDPGELKNLIIHNLERRILFTPSRKSVLTGLIAHMENEGRDLISACLK
ncbi:MAG: hypothetical protein K8T10_08375 [Candidatus Eremiobacteraeota bacterium]|nr:hypothetical protein [Candidatus Eremiobacteraeota bacterium]